MRNRLSSALLAISLLAGFSGCTTPTPTAPGTTPAFDRTAASRDVFAAREGYVVAEALATAYAKLPRCHTPPVLPCSDQAVLNQITKARDVARASLDAADSAVNNPAFGDSVASTAVVTGLAGFKAFSAITATLNK